jgi:hypothetical protein
LPFCPSFDPPKRPDTGGAAANMRSMECTDARMPCDRSPGSSFFPSGFGAPIEANRPDAVTYVDYNKHESCRM